MITLLCEANLFIYSVIKATLQFFSKFFIIWRLEYGIVLAGDIMDVYTFQRIWFLAKILRVVHIERAFLSTENLYFNIVRL